MMMVKRVKKILRVIWVVQCHEEMTSDGEVEAVGPSKDISLDKTKPKDAGKKKKCC